MNRLRRLLHRHRWTTLTVTCGSVVITVHGCWCGERQHTTKGRS